MGQIAVGFMQASGVDASVRLEVHRYCMAEGTSTFYLCFKSPLNVLTSYLSILQACGADPAANWSIYPLPPLNDPFIIPLLALSLAGPQSFHLRVRGFTLSLRKNEEALKCDLP